MFTVHVYDPTFGRWGGRWQLRKEAAERDRCSRQHFSSVLEVQTQLNCDGSEMNTDLVEFRSEDSLTDFYERTICLLELEVTRIIPIMLLTSVYNQEIKLQIIWENFCLSYILCCIIRLFTLVVQFDLLIAMLTHFRMSHFMIVQMAAAMKWNPSCLFKSKKLKLLFSLKVNTLFVFHNNSNSHCWPGNIMIYVMN